MGVLRQPLEQAGVMKKRLVHATAAKCEHFRVLLRSPQENSDNGNTQKTKRFKNNEVFSAKLEEKYKGEQE